MRKGPVCMYHNPPPSHSLTLCVVVVLPLTFTNTKRGILMIIYECRYTVVVLGLIYAIFYYNSTLFEASKIYSQQSTLLFSISQIQPKNNVPSFSSISPFSYIK